MKSKAFTLAEVLITLMIIGIVAALTIPSVISNYQQQEFKTGLKKAVSVLNEAIQTNIAVEGETPYENNDLFTYLQRHMSVGEANAGKYDNSSNPELYGKYNANWHFYTTDGMRFERPRIINNIANGFILHETNVRLDPMQARMNGYNTSYYGHCGSYGLNRPNNHTVTYPCVITVDVNGDKKPNPDTRISYFANGTINWIPPVAYAYPNVNDKKITDVFNILITEDRAIPFGIVAQRAMYSK